jgi:hypothetical protein
MAFDRSIVGEISSTSKAQRLRIELEGRIAKAEIGCQSKQRQEASRVRRSLQWCSGQRKPSKRKGVSLPKRETPSL